MKFEYAVFALTQSNGLSAPDIANALQKHGDRGWELVTQYRHNSKCVEFTFKRPLHEMPDTNITSSYFDPTDREYEAWRMLVEETKRNENAETYRLLRDAANEFRNQAADLRRKANNAPSAQLRNWAMYKSGALSSKAKRIEDFLASLE